MEKHPRGQELQLGVYNLAPIADFLVKSIVIEELRHRYHNRIDQDTLADLKDTPSFTPQERKTLLRDCGALDNCWLLIPGEEARNNLGIADERVVLGMAHTDFGIRSFLLRL